MDWRPATVVQGYPRNRGKVQRPFVVMRIVSCLRRLKTTMCRRCLLAKYLPGLIGRLPGGQRRVARNQLRVQRPLCRTLNLRGKLAREREFHLERRNLSWSQWQDRHHPALLAETGIFDSLRRRGSSVYAFFMPFGSRTILLGRPPEVHSSKAYCCRRNSDATHEQRPDQV
jgi:hypothetical protein